MPLHVTNWIRRLPQPIRRETLELEALALQAVIRDTTGQSLHSWNPNIQTWFCKAITVSQTFPKKYLSSLPMCTCLKSMDLTGLIRAEFVVDLKLFLATLVGVCQLGWRSQVRHLSPIPEALLLCIPASVGASHPYHLVLGGVPSLSSQPSYFPPLFYPAIVLPFARLISTSSCRHHHFWIPLIVYRQQIVIRRCEIFTFDLLGGSYQVMTYDQ